MIFCTWSLFCYIAGEEVQGKFKVSGSITQYDNARQQYMNYTNNLGGNVLLLYLSKCEFDISM